MEMIVYEPCFSKAFHRMLTTGQILGGHVTVQGGYPNDHRHEQRNRFKLTAFKMPGKIFDPIFPKI